MRITFVVSHGDLSGGMRVIATYADRLQKRGHDVTVVSRPKRRPTLKERVKKLMGKPLPWEARPVFKTHLDGLSFKNKIIDGFRPIVPDDLPDADVLIATWWETLEWVWPAASSKGVKVHFMQDYEIFGGEKSRVDATCRLPVRRIVIARWVQELLEREFGDTTSVLIPNAIDHSLFHAKPRGKQPTPTVGTTYTRMRNKGTDIAFEAYARAKKVVPNLKLISFGGGLLDPKLVVPPEAEFLHRLPDEKLRDVYSRCDAWLFGTRVEAFGLPVLEAMACRTPVIGTPAGAAPELIGGGGGILVPLEDPQAMADAIVRMTQMSEEQWRKMSDLAFATASRFTWDQAVDRFESVLIDATASL
jgi:glycosyltransferase involved in cell wall biosynthesis